MFTVKQESEDTDSRPKRRRADGPSLPMPHDGGPPPSADDDEPTLVPAEHPMWLDLFNHFGRRPAPPSECWGCRRGKLRVVALPYEAYTRMGQDLHPRIVEHGLVVAAEWAGEYFENHVLKAIIAPPEQKKGMEWSGVSIVWHFMDHTNIAQFRQLRVTLELQYASNYLINNRLFVRPTFGAPGGSSLDVDPNTVKTVNYILEMLRRQQQADPKKQNTYHEGLGVAETAPRTLSSTTRFTGRGILHK